MKILCRSSVKFFFATIFVLLACFAVVKIGGVKLPVEVDNFIENFGMLLLALISASFFTLFVRPEVFKSWLHFLCWWIVPLLIAYSLSSARGGGFSGINPWQPLFPILLGLFALSTPVYLYFKSKKLK